MMPTTRRGRFLLYKQRARRRLKRVYEHAKHKHVAAAGEHRPTNRRYDFSGFTLQAHRVYPKHFPEKALTPAQYTLRGWTKPGWIHFAIIKYPPLLPAEGFPFDLRNGTALGYHDRRVKHLPRLHSLPILPYPFPANALPQGRFFPFPVYPSGRPSYAASQGWV